MNGNDALRIFLGVLFAAADWLGDKWSELTFWAERPLTNGFAATLAIIVYSAISSRFRETDRLINKHADQIEGRLIRFEQC